MKNLKGENIQLRKLMDEYLKEIDQIKYAYNRLRSRFEDQKVVCKNLESLNSDLQCQLIKLKNREWRYNADKIVDKQSGRSKYSSKDFDA